MSPACQLRASVDYQMTDQKDVHEKRVSHPCREIATMRALSCSIGMPNKITEQDSWLVLCASIELAIDMQCSAESKPERADGR